MNTHILSYNTLTTINSWSAACITNAHTLCSQVQIRQSRLPTRDFTILLAICVGLDPIICVAMRVQHRQQSVEWKLGEMQQTGSELLI